jgi:putative FmdB family regulatory protein
MPVFEYSCSDCDTSYEILHRGAEREDAIVCPSCDSRRYRKRFSVFAAATAGAGGVSSCSDGSCAPAPSSPCFGGSCGLG